MIEMMTLVNRFGTGTAAAYAAARTSVLFNFLLTGGLIAALIAELPASPSALVAHPPRRTTSPTIPCNIGSPDADQNESMSPSAWIRRRARLSGLVCGAR